MSNLTIDELCIAGNNYSVVQCDNYNAYINRPESGMGVDGWIQFGIVIFFGSAMCILIGAACIERRSKKKNNEEVLTPVADDVKSIYDKISNMA